MSRFVLPTFNVTVNIWRVTGVGGDYTVPDVVVLGNLTPGRRAILSSVTFPIFTTFTVPMELLLPPLTDIRASYNGVLPDLVEIPAGSRRMYDVIWVDDIGKGFANEHRIAMVAYIRSFTVPTGGSSGFTAGSPVPLP